MTAETLKAPFPWFGGKSRVADLVWQRFGAVPNYVEPFFGSGAVLLARPDEPRTETVNDKDAYLANFWRAIRYNPDETAQWADWPVSEADLLARHRWLMGQQERLVASLRNDPEFFDTKVAGWWVWGLCSWIGSGWCRRRGKGNQPETTPLRRRGKGNQPEQIPHLGDAGRDVHQKRPHLMNGGKGLNSQRAGDVYDYFEALNDRLRSVRVCCGDWQRVLGESVTIKHGVTGVFLDPPYSVDRSDCYSVETDCSPAVREWAITNGDNPLLRIALCGYEGEHAMPATWGCVPWKARGGYGSQSDGRGRENATRERIWFSPHCINPQEELFSL